ncbi:hypothetical protein J507_3167 [Acinetobacter sp. 1295259]|uniref:hypothetical protein n=1 Tax=Acinetobacter calcoaceticus/baumannii complex TaxID=909768 RepID=UPI0004482B7A|nr:MULTISPECIES: hypothetical protein [Acinetobacter calcoaceticus/baumannii complex]EXA96566.1 hypothetical protein J507_3167 [Acinetobacter sp. 1295259]RSO69551.1 hypothetical protein EA754_20030 [Acinetobacter pittii]
MKFNASIDIAIIISLIAVFLFANGQVYLGGYLGTFGIDPVLLNLSIQDKLYIGYLEGFIYLLVLVFVLMGYVILLYTVRSTDLFIKFNNFLDRKLNEHHRKNSHPTIHNSTRYEEIDKDYKNHSFLIIALLVLLLSTLSLLANTEKKAQEEANNDLKQFKFKQVYLKADPKVSELFIVRCGSNYCAVINKEKKVWLEEPKNLSFTPYSENS